MSRPLRLRAAWCALLAATGGQACVDDLPEQWQLDGRRLLAARWVPDDGSERAWVRPGEAGAVEFFFVDPPDRPAETTWGFVVCDGTVAPTGEAFCLGPMPDLRFEATPQTPVAPFAVQAESDPVGTDLVTLGIFCSGPEGGTVPTPTIATGNVVEDCFPAGGGVNRFQLAIPYELTETNTRPSFERAVVAIDGLLDFWPAPSGDANCEGTEPGRPMISAGSEAVDFTVVVDANDREEVPGANQLEALTFGHVASTGTLDRFFSVIDDRTSEVRVEWVPPASVPPDGLARFAFIVNDGRAGFDWIVRELCVVP